MTHGSPAGQSYWRTLPWRDSPRRPLSKGAGMKLVIKIAIALTLLLAVATFAAAQSQWAPLTNGITILDQNGNPYQVPVGPVWQLRDGRVLVHEEQDNFPQNWFVLTPDAQGSYLNG